jgi:hypothetical protein
MNVNDLFDLGQLGRTRTTQPIDPSHVDYMLAKELQQMSFQDRNGVEEEIHGVHTCAVDETPELVHECMDQFQREIDASSIDLKDAYVEAILMNGTSLKYVQDFNFRLKFLRAEKFDVKGAVRRFLLLLSGLRRYYGSFALERPLRHDDMDKASKDLLRAGVMQFLPSRDRAGRLIIVSQGTMSNASIITRVRRERKLGFVRCGCC